MTVHMIDPFGLEKVNDANIPMHLNKKHHDVHNSILGTSKRKLKNVVVDNK